MNQRHFFSVKDAAELVADEAERIKENLQRLPPGVERERLMKRALELDARASLARWAASSDVRPPS